MKLLEEEKKVDFFEVKCDESNNPAWVVDQCELFVDLSIREVGKRKKKNLTYEVGPMTVEKKNGN